MFQKNDEFELDIIDMSVEGDGIGRKDGFTFFVKDAVSGDRCLVGVTKLKKSYGYARLIRVIEPSKDRVDPACPIAKACGGCCLQALSYGKQLELKEKTVREDLIRIGGFSPEEVDTVLSPIIGMEEGFRYRNKAQYPIGIDGNGEIVIGYYAARSHRIVPLPEDDCLLVDPVNARIIKALKEYMKSCGVSAYDEGTGRGLLRHLLIRIGYFTGEIMVCLVVNKKSCKDPLPQFPVFLDMLSGIPGMISVSVNFNPERTNVILGKTTHTLWGREKIEDIIPDGEREGVRFLISPRSFYQVNPRQMEKLYQKALEYADLSGKETVYDLYCGIGTISLFLSRRAKKVYGVEIVPEAIEDAKENAARNGIENAEFFVGKAEELLPKLREEHADETVDVIVVDPPRKGCDEVCLSTMLLMQPKRIVYVSCDPATLARDLRILCDGGYRLSAVTPCEQFGQTGHVETVCLLSKLHEAKHHINVKVDMDELDLTTGDA